MCDRWGDHQNDVFVPNERVFMDGEWQFSRILVQRFAGYHRQSYGGCKVGVGDVLIGAAATATEYAGVAKASHVRRKLSEGVHLNETLYACGLGGTGDHDRPVERSGSKRNAGKTFGQHRVAGKNIVNYSRNFEESVTT
ncbi:MAG: hypothetical protein E3J25_02950 [Anaerolineales bacterium]|nr:MAG: hypothetical protein E3J25_02950 [Anaerolineales bacterium]